ncbi:MAG: threonine ammonia-lyase [Alphaproteobacteria bacterium]
MRWIKPPISSTRSLPNANDVYQASLRLQGKIRRTPTMNSALVTSSLGFDSGTDIYMKLENLQETGSFKARGSLNALALLVEEKGEALQGVVTMSAGNHAQGLAYHAQKMGISCTIVMPEDTPFVKVRRCQAMGAEVVLHGQHLDDSAQYAKKIADGKKIFLIHPYDDAAVIAGQGTATLEMLEDTPPLDILLVPIGGGGLMAGGALACLHQQQKITLIGVQAAACPAAKAILQGKAPMQYGSTLAEGIAVKYPGELTLPILADHVSDIITVSEEQIEQAVQILLNQGKLLAEGAGAAGIAALLAAPDLFRGKKTGVVVCGGNIDASLLSSLLLRGLFREGKLGRIRIQLRDQPGQLARISTLIGDAGANIIEVLHNRLINAVPLKQTIVDMVIESRSERHLHHVQAILEEAGFRCEIITN